MTWTTKCVGIVGQKATTLMTLPPPHHPNDKGTIPFDALGGIIFLGRISLLQFYMLRPVLSRPPQGIPCRS